jgi:peptidyl-prolyl cis-trans isomerase A (cyclophilin A)
MIQGGCPQGTGTGDPGYKFDDEFHPSLKHNRPGVLAMANSGPGTNGSIYINTFQQIGWITTYCFGHVVEGQDIVDSVADVLESLKLLE